MIVNARKRARWLTVNLIPDQSSQNPWNLDLLARANFNVDGTGGRGGHETKVFDKEVANTYVLARFVDAVLVLVCDVEAKDLKFVDALVSAQGVTAIVVDPDPDATINATRTSQFPSQSLAN
ncbi:hypothetical protein PG990_008932 [Apiospora arundinis]